MRRTIVAILGVLALAASTLVALVVAAPVPAASAAPSQLTLSAGADHTCAVYPGGTVGCWGKNTNGQLGDGTQIRRTTPVNVQGLNGVVQVAAGANHTCALLGFGTVSCWGGNSAGQLGDGTNTSSTTPKAVSGVSSAVAIAVGDTHSCALLSGGTVRCWGSNASGQLGDSSGIDRSTSVTVTGISTATAIGAGARQTCAVLSDKTVRCWGANGSGQLGDSTKQNRLAPVVVTGLTNATAVTGGAAHSCALLGDGTAQCWGDNGSGQLGDGSTTNSTSPVAVFGLTGATAIEAGAQHTCSRQSNGSERCWGDNFYGKLGDGTITSRLVPTAVSGLTTVAGIAAGDDHSCAVLSDQTLRCWGYNFFGQLGIGSADDLTHSLPVGVAGLSTVPGGFNGITPTRVLDTREPGGGACISTERSIAIAGQDGTNVPPLAGAVAINVTAVGAKAAGYVTVWPDGTSRPTASVLNFTKGNVVPNNMMVKLGDNGAIRVFANTGCPELVIDVVGWFTPGTPGAGGFQGVTPFRLLDTRVPGQGPCVTGDRIFTAAGFAGSGVPGNAASVALNVTVVTPSTSGFVTAYPGFESRPNASTLNYVPGQVVPNGTIVKVGAGGTVDVYANAGCPHIVVDVVGWFAAGPPGPGGFLGVSPYRLLDTRSNGGCVNGDRALVVTGGPSGVPADAGSVALNVTAIQASLPGFVTVYPAGVARPTASNLNYEIGQIVPNGVLVAVGAFDAVNLYANAGCPNLVADVVGYWAASG